ncbi:MAG: hypothetical protein EZS28_008758 [Streblomastix strix]|uniref:Uncharacterized protein n=1 Tax=Streblomastix strix TaxID=222440 RepID=A0A5J4WLM2_9EUKA|nr:MAG: hypothetical protein EZS28_008758 [Streblomastix strix]
MYDKSKAVQVLTSGILDFNDCQFAGTYVLDNYQQSNEGSNGFPSDPLEPDSYIDQEIIKHEKLLEQPKQYPAVNIFDIVDDGNCKVCVFNLFFVSKGITNYKQQILGTIPDQLLPANGKSMAFPATVIRNAGAKFIQIGMSYFVIDDSEEVYQCCTSGTYCL